MNAALAIARLRRLRVPAFTTADAAAALSLSVPAASMLLRRMVASGVAFSITHGLWTLDERADPLLLPEILSAPYPSYVSLQSALYLHGMISQIPETTFAVTLGRTKRVRTKVGVFSFHHMAPEFFGSFEVTSSGVKLATTEKALLDVFYLSATRTRLFSALPELDLTARFSQRKAKALVGRIPSRRIRAIVRARLDVAAPVQNPS